MRALCHPELISHILISALILSSSLACDGEDEGTTTLSRLELDIMIHAVSGDAHVGCVEPFALNDDEEPSFHVKDLRLFVHDVELKAKGGDWTPLEMKNDGEWSDGVVTLLDYEDGGNHCSEGGTLFQNHVVRGSLPAGDYESIRFRIGVPHELNHGDVTTAAPPLNVSSMFWVWQRGYKFARIELLREVEGEMKPWLFHLGSTGCESPAPTAAPEVPCAKTNSPQITLDQFDPTSDQIALDLRALLRDLDLDMNTEETPSGCMSMPSESLECSPLYDNLNLDFASGEVSCTGEECEQSFRVVSLGDHKHTDHNE